MDNPLVSVIIPSFNHAPYIGSAIQSVRQQTYPNWELIVIDDGSTDGSVDVIRSELYRAGIKNARLLVQDNSGAHSAINRGISESRGDYISILNSDDTYHTERLSRIIGSMRHHGALIAGSEVALIHEDDSLVSPQSGRRAWYEAALLQARSLPSPSFALLLSNLFLTTSNLVIHRSMLGSTSTFSSGRFAHDWDFLLTGLLKTEPLMLPERLLRYRLHDQNTWLKGRQDTVQEVTMILQRYFENCENPTCQNTRRPSKAAWGETFSQFIATHRVLGFDIPLSSLCPQESEDKRPSKSCSPLTPEMPHLRPAPQVRSPHMPSAIDPEFQRIPWQRRWDIYRFLPLLNTRRISTVIFGAGSGGAITFRKLPLRYKVVAFVDSDKSLQRNRIHGISVQPPEWLVQHQWDLVIVSSSRAREITGILSQLSVPPEKVLYEVPSS